MAVRATYPVTYRRCACPFTLTAARYPVKVRCDYSLRSLSVGGGAVCERGCSLHIQHNRAGGVWQALIAMFVRLFSSSTRIACSTLFSPIMHIPLIGRINRGGVYAAGCIKCEQYAAGENTDGARV